MSHTPADEFLKSRRKGAFSGDIFSETNDDDVLVPDIFPDEAVDVIGKTALPCGDVKRGHGRAGIFPVKKRFQHMTVVILWF